MTPFLLQVLNGVAFGMLLFLLAAGLSLIFGSMKILNLTHGSYYLLGGYIGYSVVRATGSFVLAAVAACIIVGVLGILMERFFLRRFHQDELPQALLTFGFVFIFADVCFLLWGGNPLTLPKPAPLTRSIDLGVTLFPTYRVFLIAIGAVIAALLWWFLDRTRLGAMVRAGVDDEETTRAIGINVSALFMGVYGTGAALAALGGVLGGALVGVYPGADFEVLLLGFVVVIVGGLGSLRGALVGALFVGLADNFGKAYFPELAPFSMFLPMVLILTLRPNGLFGRQ
jgi:branched-chain amino acid transport system permease protein